MSVYYLGLGVFLVLIEVFYFRVARRFHIIDEPGVRSSHQIPTVRGGGIIFVIAALIWFMKAQFPLRWFMLGMAMVAIISLLDDLKPRPVAARVGIQTAAVTLMFYELSLFDWPWWLAALALVICVGALNAFNFMDGINGITGLYALVNLSTFAYINLYVVEFADGELITTLIISVIVFLFFNFRMRAVCFAGDVGSVTIAFIQILLLLMLILQTDNFLWVILFLVYGFDSTITIVLRLVNKKNILTPHRTHLYQYLANEFGWPHRLISVLYMAAQLLLNGVLVFSFLNSYFFLPLAASLAFVVFYLSTRLIMHRRIKRANAF
ncbi:MAG: UDP-GlcNAc--UDP-phosphate GlcNAc-1-phosphate transferase [Cytophagales bacterium]|nr:UDP-GlcNAc--UDP-phosphate GlcNAc-1-phosphate transferase [Cytophagales bacterium]